MFRLSSPSWSALLDRINLHLLYYPQPLNNQHKQGIRSVLKRCQDIKSSLSCFVGSSPTNWARTISITRHRYHSTHRKKSTDSKSAEHTLAVMNESNEDLTCSTKEERGWGGWGITKLPLYQIKLSTCLNEYPFYVQGNILRNCKVLCMCPFQLARQLPVPSSFIHSRTCITARDMKPPLPHSLFWMITFVMLGWSFCKPMWELQARITYKSMIVDSRAISH